MSGLLTSKHKLEFQIFMLVEWVAIPFSRGIFPTQGSNPGFPYCRQILYCLSYQGSPRMLEWVIYPISRPHSAKFISAILYFKLLSIILLLLKLVTNNGGCKNSIFNWNYIIFAANYQNLLFMKRTVLFFAIVLSGLALFFTTCHSPKTAPKEAFFT